MIPAEKLCFLGELQCELQITLSFTKFYKVEELFTNYKLFHWKITITVIRWYLNDSKWFLRLYRMEIINLFHVTVSLLYSLKTRGFLMLSGGIEGDQWYEIG